MTDTITSAASPQHADVNQTPGRRTKTKGRKRKSDKPAKPYPDFPLFPHATRRWAKKVRGKLYYFGPWDDPMAALAKYQAQRDDLHAGRAPRSQTDGLTVADLCNRFLTAKRHALTAGELSMASWHDYYRACERLVSAFGKTRLVTDLRPADFQKLRAEFAKNWGPVRLGNEINRVRVTFNFAFKNGLIEKPVLFGSAFQRPNKKTLRKERAKRGPRMFERHELRAMIDGALVVGAEGPELVQPGPALHAMILLAANCGFGNTDVGTLPHSALDLDGGWIRFPRPKTGIDRRCPLWRETVQALRDWLAIRPKPARSEHADLVFLTAKRGQPWIRPGYVDDDGKPRNVADNQVSKEAAKLLRKLGINGSRGFYSIRHGFLTVAEEQSRDFPAVRFIMGHADSSISDHYRERISDDRLRAVAEAVRSWLFPCSEVARGSTRT
jgi:integrase